MAPTGDLYAQEASQTAASMRENVPKTVLFSLIAQADLADLAALFLSAHRFFIISEIRLRAAALI
jgi:hypothetical protein